MLTEQMRLFIESTGNAFVASADRAGKPHLAAGKDLQVKDRSHLTFESWFCHTTMENVTVNPRVAIAVTGPAAEKGYQFCGTVLSAGDTAILDGFVPNSQEIHLPQVQYRLVIRIDEVLEFSSGIHSDQPF